MSFMYVAMHIYLYYSSNVLHQMYICFVPVSLLHCDAGPHEIAVFDADKKEESLGLKGPVWKLLKEACMTVRFIFRVIHSLSDRLP